MCGLGAGNVDTWQAMKTVVLASITYEHREVCVPGFVPTCSYSARCTCSYYKIQPFVFDGLWVMYNGALQVKRESNLAYTETWLLHAVNRMERKLQAFPVILC